MKEGSGPPRASPTPVQLFPAAWSMACAALPVRSPAENLAADLKTEKCFSYFGRPDRKDRIYINCSECKRTLREVDMGSMGTSQGQ